MTVYHVDNGVENDGNGTEDHPWLEIRPHVNDLLPGDRMLLHGDQLGPRVYRENMISLRASGVLDAPISIMPCDGDQIELQEISGQLHQSIFDARGDWWRLVSLGMNKQNEFNGGCVLIQGNHNAVVNSFMRNVHGGWIVRNTGGNNNIIDRCTIQDGKKGANQDCHGIFIDGGFGVVISRNDVHSVYGDCVQVYDKRPAGALRVVNNHFRAGTAKDGAENGLDVKRYDGDEPMIVAGNTIEEYRYCSGENGGTGSNGEGILLHMNARNIHVLENLIRNCTNGLRIQADDVLCRRNVFDGISVVADPASWLRTAIYVNGARAVVEHNTFYNCPDRVLRVDREFRLRNNLFYRTGAIDASVAAEAHNNGWFRAQAMLSGPGDVIGDDPRLTDDFRLLPDSACIDAGAKLDEPFAGEAPDLGAYEYIGGPEPPVEGEFVLIGKDHVLVFTGATQGGVPVVRLEKVS